MSTDKDDEPVIVEYDDGTTAELPSPREWRQMIEDEKVLRAQFDEFWGKLTRLVEGE